MKPAYYNEHDKFAAQWLRNLIAAGHIAAGDVDERSIVDVRPDDLAGYGQCHFFAGIGGWSYAARLAGISDDEPIWTGSCPCQPFSAAGKQKAEADARHLWPEFRRLIAERRPATVFGEQVASKLGRGWLAGVRSDLEALGYAVGAADLCAASVGAPHIRQRLWWLAYPGGGLARHRDLQPGGEHRQQPQDGGAGERVGKPAGVGRQGIGPEPAHCEPVQADKSGGEAGGVANPIGADQRRHAGNVGEQTDARSGEARTSNGNAVDGAGAIERLADADEQRHDWRGPRSAGRDEPADGGRDGRLGHALGAGLEGRAGEPGELRAERERAPVERDGEAERVADAGSERRDGEPIQLQPGGSQPTGLETAWSGATLIPCADGKARRVGPGVQPLAYGVPSRVGRLRAYGNAIVPQVAAEFMMAAMEVITQ